jgi:hypothetical protein
MSDQYVAQRLAVHAVATGPLSPAEQAASLVAPTIEAWAGAELNDLRLSGSYAKGTAVRGSADVDLFISMRSTRTLQDIYTSLFARAAVSGWQPRRQNVSVGVTLGTVKIDLVPGRVQTGYQNFHSLYKSKQDSWTQTNVSAHISHVKNSGRTDEIRAMKIWRNRLGVEFPSFYLELLTIEALKWSRGGLADNVMAVFRYIDTNLASTRFIDPANTANVISDDLTAAEKFVVLVRAREALAARYWSDILG